MLVHRQLQVSKFLHQMPKFSSHSWWETGRHVEKWGMMWEMVQVLLVLMLRLCVCECVPVVVGLIQEHKETLKTKQFVRER